MVRFITVADVKTYLDGKSDSTDDALLDMLVAAVSARVESFLSRNMVAASRTQKFNGGARRYVLDAYPIAASPAPVVTVDGLTMTVDLDYWVHPEQGYIEFLVAPAATKPRIVSITWTGGYAQDATSKLVDVPEDIKLAVMLQVAFMFKRRKELGLESVTMPNGTINTTSTAKLLQEVERILRAYRNFRL